MSSSDHPTHEHGHEHHHPEHEGMYQDKDISDTPDHDPVGEYPDTSDHVPGTDDLQPHDEGSFADTDVVSEHRHPAAEGSFADIDIEGEDVAANQVERAHHARTDADDIHTTPHTSERNPTDG